jgi:hypothetical protein
MKTTVLTITLFLAGIFTVIAQDGAYEKAMAKAMEEMGAAQSPDQMLAAANTFERISQKASDEYLPLYYAALNMVNYSWTLQEAKQKDEILDRALALVEKANAVSPGNDEVEVMNGYALMAKMTVDPMNRGQAYSPRIMQSFGKAMSMDPTNPRAKIMMAQMELGTAQFMGTEPTNACNLAKEGAELLAEEEAKGFEPSWGMDSANYVLQNCSQQ